MIIAAKQIKVTSKMSRAKKINITISVIVLAILALGMLYPILLIVNMSMKSWEEYLVSPISLVKKLSFANYQTVWQAMDVFKRTFTTVWITAIALIINIAMSIMAAYPLSRGHFRGHGKVYIFFLASMFFPGSLVANIILLKDILNVYGSPVALIIIWSIGSLQLNIFMLYNFIKSLPRDLDEAAFIDGCSYFRYVFTIAMPLMMPIVVTLVMLKAIGCWNDFLGPFIYITDPEFHTLATGLYLFGSGYTPKWNEYAAAIFIVATPMIVLYCLTQKFIISGMISGAIKG